MELFNNLPLYLMDIDPEDEAISAVNCVALVNVPAIKRNFQAFNESRQRFTTDVARQIIGGPAMLANTPIYRRDEARGEYYCYFTPESIERIALKFFRNNFHANVNEAHNDALAVDGMTLFESFIVDASRGVLPMVGFEDVPQGSWFLSYKVDNPAVWEKVTDGTFQGFSVEGLFKVDAVSHEAEAEQAYRNIIALLD